MRALLIEKGGTARSPVVDELPQGNVTVEVGYSTLNYKDALARQAMAIGTAVHTVAAVTGKSAEAAYLHKLGATTVLDRAEVAAAGGPGPHRRRRQPMTGRNT